MSVSAERRVQEASSCTGNYVGADCSQRLCPYGLSANTSPFLKNGLTGEIHTDDELYAPTSRISECNLVDGACVDVFPGNTDKFLGTHTYAECSSQGVCDRDTGTCNCFDGYTGVGCRYTTCPNDCSGHGMCRQNAFANPDYDSAGSKLYFGSQYWDAFKTMRCVCDRGYQGVDCSERICPRGDDILTTCLADSVHDVQVIDLAFDDVLANFDEKSKFFVLEYTDGFNGVYHTRPIPVMDDATATASLTQIALEALPNDALPTVQVSGATSGNTQSLSVTFSDHGSPGMQQDLGCMVRTSDEKCSAGQQPFIDSDLTTGSFTCTNSGHSETDPTMFEENAVCGNRGICDTATGKCDCFEGHTGAACDIYSVYV